MIEISRAAVRNFSYHYIKLGLSLFIPEGQHMITYFGLEIDGQLTIDGCLVLL